MQLRGASECGSSTRCWIGLQVRRIGCSICGALALVALAPPLPVSAVSDNDVVLESESESEVESESEIVVSTETEAESSDISESESEVDSDYSDIVSDNSVTSGSAAESESFDSDSSVSDNSVNYNIDLYNNYDVYDGSISSTYLEFMRGFLPKLDWDEHYVAARVSRYDYIFAFSNSLTYDGVFTGSNVVVVKWNTSQDYAAYTVTVEPTFTLAVNSNLVYSDLTHQFPSLADSSAVSLRQIVVFLAISVTVWTVGTFLRRTPVASRRRRRW
ncbi:MAG: hypothetical protein H9L35_11260 [Acinetobacter sp.]|uniref:hypothetical protein n=1 Tax=Acinetobacter sp. TaxID=472 RepID=UPI0019C12108|nr:hypothetical protein [Acinetobacter sp.]MBC6676763.1 hypothetical protein [Acinetobacter sp.]